MNYCQELISGQLVSLTAIPVGDCLLNPSAALSPYLNTSQLQVSYDNSINFGREAIEDGDVIHIIKDSIKVDDKEDNQIAGRCHNVTIKAELDERSEDVWMLVRRLEANPYCFMLLFKSGTQLFVSATEDAYLCTIDRDEDKSQLVFKVQNLAGVQVVTE